MYSSADKCYKYIPSQPDRPAVSCLEEQQAVAQLRTEICRLAQEHAACPVFVYDSEQLIAPLLRRLVVQDIEKNQLQLLQGSGVVYLPEVFSGQELLDMTEVRKFLAVARGANLSDCRGSSRLLYLLLRHRLGSSFSSASAIQPFCRRLKLTATPELTASNDNVSIFYSHLPEGQAAYQIQIPSGDLSCVAGARFSRLLVGNNNNDNNISSNSSSDEEVDSRTDAKDTAGDVAVVTDAKDVTDKTCCKTEVDVARTDLRLVMSNMLMETNRCRVRGDSLDSEGLAESIQGVAAMEQGDERETPNQVRSSYIYFFSFLALFCVKKKVFL
jgi:hypothetical protein